MKITVKKLKQLVREAVAEREAGLTIDTSSRESAWIALSDALEDVQWLPWTLEFNAELASERTRIRISLAFQDLKEAIDSRSITVSTANEAKAAAAAAMAACKPTLRLYLRAKPTCLKLQNAVDDLMREIS